MTTPGAVSPVQQLLSCFPIMLAPWYPRIASRDLDGGERLPVPLDPLNFAADHASDHRNPHLTAAPLDKRQASKRLFATGGSSEKVPFHPVRPRRLRGHKHDIANRASDPAETAARRGFCDSPGSTWSGSGDLGRYLVGDEAT
jgi:hypothetical protein